MLINTERLKEMLTNATLSTAKEKDSILNNSLIEIKDNRITVISMSNTTTLIQQAETETTEKAKFLIDAQKLSNILKEISEKEIELNISEKNIEIKSSSFKTSLKIKSPELFPAVEEKEYQTITKTETEKLKKLIRDTIYCPDKRDIAREYTGIFLEFEENNIKATATDHYRLINVKTENPNQQQISLIIENDGAALINRIPLKGEVEILKSNDEIVVKTDNTTIISKLILGSFPDYNQILLNPETSNIISLNKEKFKESVKRSSIISQNREIMLQIDINSAKATVVGQNQEGETAEDSLNITPRKADSNLIIKLDSKFILDFLNQIVSEEVNMIYKTGEDPIMFEAEEENYSYKYIMTPIIE